MTGERIAPIELLIVTIRGQRVILAGDLARIYGVVTRVLNQAIKRNPAKFPADFVFQITRDEVQEMRRLRSQTVILRPGQHLKYLP
ncbi:MAG: ORF6N domain-containing protein [candidate division NC10 bacterium]|nr:ORF6N domain-containing protein [candidate division NC10 bacterium]